MTCKRMSSENMFQIQNQVRENSEDLQNYLKDLETWEKDMKKKEEELQFLKITEDDVIPPIRNTLSKSKKKNRHKKQKEKEKTSEAERISSFNYKAWEKFDVQSELKKLDEEKKDSSASESSDTEDQINMQKKKQLAILKKDKGNDCFKKGMYDCAINCYTAGMELDPENPLLPANRAMAFIKKEQFQAAENDCSTCLSLDPTYIKAYLRRATARSALKKFHLAEEDYLKILELEPTNKSAQAELEKMKKENFVNPDMKQAAISPSEFNESFEEGSIKRNKEAPSSKLENLLNAMESPQPFIIPSKEISDNQFSQNSHSLYSKDPTNQSVQLEGFTEIESIVKKMEQTLPPVPSAAYQFLADWRKLSKYPDLKYQYLKQFPPERLPIVFKHDMEAEIFCGILQTLSTSFLNEGNYIFSFMKYLTQVGRFHTLLMFLSQQEKKDLKMLLERLKSTKHDLAEIQKLLKQYQTS